MEKFNLNDSQFVIKDGYLETVWMCDKKIVIPFGVEVIGELAFDIKKDINGIDEYFDRENIEEVEMPNTLIRIESGAFRYCDLKSIKLPSSLKVIGRLAFATNVNLEKVELSDSVEEIESYAFVTNTQATSKIFQDHSYDKNHYIIDIPSSFVINYTSYEKLDNLLELLRKSGSFGSNTYKFRIFRVPRFVFTLVGPMLSKSERLKIYKKLLLMKCKKVNFVNNDAKIELPEYDIVDENMVNEGQNIVVSESINEGRVK